MNGLEIVIIAYSLFEVRSRDPTRRLLSRIRLRRARRRRRTGIRDK